MGSGRAIAAACPLQRRDAARRPFMPTIRSTRKRAPACRPGGQRANSWAPGRCRQRPGIRWRRVAWPIASMALNELALVALLEAMEPSSRSEGCVECALQRFSSGQCRPCRLPACGPVCHGAGGSAHVGRIGVLAWPADRPWAGAPGGGGCQPASVKRWRWVRLVPVR